MLDKFNAVAGLILDGALREFPMPAVLDTQGIVRTLPDEWRTPNAQAGPVYGDVHRDDVEYVRMVNEWLREEGFLRDKRSNLSNTRSVLTSKGISGLNAAPNWMDDSESLGTRLSKAVANRSWQLVAGVIPAVIGASIN